MWPTSRVRLAIVIAIALIAPDARAQAGVETSPPVVTGDTLRVWAPPARLDGVIATLARVDLTNLVLQGRAPNPNTPAREWSVPLSSVTKVEVLRRRERSAGRVIAGVVIGGLLGAAVGAPMGPIIECGGACDDEGDLKPQVGYGLGAAIGAPIGMLIGGVIGGMRPARWHSVTFTVR